jgi:hypothetical protein
MYSDWLLLGECLDGSGEGEGQSCIHPLSYPAHNRTSCIESPRACLSQGGVSAVGLVDIPLLLY